MCDGVAYHISGGMASHGFNFIFYKLFTLTIFLFFFFLFFCFAKFRTTIILFPRVF